jgi:hypothetical protein
VAIPTFTRDGLLPAGTYPCTIPELEDSLGFSDSRKAILDGLKRLLAELPEPGTVLYVLVDGSFVESKTDPSDVDIVVAVENLRDNQPGYRVLQWVENRHGSIKALMRCDAYVSDEAFISEYWEVFFGHTRDNRAKGKLKLMTRKEEGLS